MPAAVPIAMLGGSAVSGALGGKGRQAANSGATNQTTNQSASSASGGTNVVTPNENPIFTQFRESLLPGIASQYNLAQKPLYGDQQTAEVTNAANNNYNSAISGITQQMARRGALTGGNFTDAASAIDAARAGEITNFTNQIPLLNQQNKFNQTQQVLGMGAGLVGQSPIGSTTTGTNTGSNSGTSNTVGASSGQYFGPSFGSGLASGASSGLGLGGLMGLNNLYGGQGGGGGKTGGKTGGGGQDFIPYGPGY